MVRLRLASSHSLLALVLAIVVACDLFSSPEDERPPSAPPAEQSDVDAQARFQPGTDAAVLTFAGERGTFEDGKNVDDVPADSRGLVKVSLLDGPAPPDGYVWAANFRSSLLVIASQMWTLPSGPPVASDLPPGNSATALPRS